MRTLTPVLFLVLLIQSCQSGTGSPRMLPLKDTSIHADNAFSTLALTPEDLQAFKDSSQLDDSIAYLLDAFYLDRNFHYAWFHPDGPFHHSQSFLRRLEDVFYTYEDSSFYYPHLFALREAQDRNEKADWTVQEIKNFELLLTTRFFEYAQTVLGGKTNLDQKTLGWYIPKKKLDPKAFLDSLLANQGANLERYIPVNRQYRLLESRLEEYKRINHENPHWEQLELEERALKKGDVSPLVSQIRERLFILGDLVQLDSSLHFDETLEQGLMKFQARHGLQADGVLGKGTLAELNQRPEHRIRQILINLERLRWLPKEPDETYLLINIPQYRLHVYDEGVYQWSMNVIVGTEAHKTVVFSRAMKHIVFSPYWNIPPGITKKEIIPALERNPGYLEANHMEKYSGGYRQKPGPWNALGKVKFMFPNEFHIYLHGTPAMGLFHREKRAFSHGCIRLEEPGKLARFLLRHHEDIDSVQIEKWMNAGKEKYVNLKDPVPVFIVYCTAWVDHLGRTHFRNDVYGHDARLAKHLFP